uniref:DUF1421 domain-containing protein n=1 Tax=Anthurium amnicola TaxID=1678845 RepID=A0A1D1ZBN7_9ARAE
MSADSLGMIFLFFSLLICLFFSCFLCSLQNYISLEAHESSKVIHEKSRATYDTVSVDEIDCTVKKYADILLHALEGLSSRLSKLEGRTRNLESSMDDLKLSISNSSDSMDGKLRQLENSLREVQTGVEVICDKQEIAEAQMQLVKLRASKEDQPPENSNVSSDSQPPPMPFPLQHLQLPAAPSAVAPPLPIQIPPPPAPPAPNAPLPPPPQQNPPPVQFSQVPQHQVSSISSTPPREPFFSLPGPPPAEVPHQHYQPPSQLTQHLPPPPSYQPASQLAQYLQPPQQLVATPQLQPSVPHHPEVSSPYMRPPQTYPPSIHQPSQVQTVPPSLQIYGSTTNIYEPSTNRPASGQQPFPTGYGPPSGPSFSDSYPYGGSLSPYSSAREPSPFSSPPAPSSGSSYPHLPTAQILPKAPPTGSGSGGSTGNRVPIDDVVDRVTTMGFSRDLVKATVRKLTENGQPVDLNIVLDKLMNGGGGQRRKDSFGR